MKQKHTIKWFIAAIAIGLCVLVVSLIVSSQYVYIDKAVIQAPIISLSSKNSDTLQQIFVNDGDAVTAHEPVARVGNAIVTTDTAGIIVSVNKNIGQYENAQGGSAVVATMINPNTLRVVGTIDEDKGLTSIKAGDTVKFNVDAFGGKTYVGVVDEVSEASVSSSVDNIFNQRPTSKFSIYVRFDPSKYPELKSGMSARMWVYK